MKKIFALILGFTAVLLAVTAAYFSVFGLSKLFIGASLSVIIMAGTLEFSKIIIVTFLHQYWKKLAIMLKTYLLVGTIILMIITSAGIYGFLSSAYSRVSLEMDKMGGGITLLEKKIEIKKEEKIRLSDQIKTKNDRVVTLTELRKSQETRLDSLYQRGWIAAAKKTETVIKQADDNITVLNTDINSISLKIESLNDSISKYETTKLEAGNSTIAGEVGPLKYISKLTGASMDKVVNYLILLLIIVFDPLAVALIVATSSMVKIIQKEKEERTIQKRDDDFKKKVQYLADEKGNFKLQTDEIEPKKLENSLEEIAEEKLKNVVSKTITENSQTEKIEEVKEIEPKKIENSLEKKIEKIEDKIEEVKKIEEPKIEIIENQTIKKEVIKEDINSIVGNKIEDKIEEIVSPQQNTSFNIKSDTIISGLFTATTIGEEVVKQSLYSQLLYIFYDEGKKNNGDEVSSYPDFKKLIENKGIILSEKDIKDFLLICNLFKITQFKGTIGYFNKSFEEANSIVSII